MEHVVGLPFLDVLSKLRALGIAWLWGYPLSTTRQSIGRVLAWAQWLVLASDTTENVALLQIFYGTAKTPWA
jgi:hypothetical protein